MRRPAGPTVSDVVAVYSAVNNPSFPQHILDLACGCGARLQLHTRWGETLRKERAAFDDAHADCRRRSPALPYTAAHVPCPECQDGDR